MAPKEQRDWQDWQDDKKALIKIQKSSTEDSAMDGTSWLLHLRVAVHAKEFENCEDDAFTVGIPRLIH